MFQFSAAGILVVLAIVSFQVHAQGLRAYTTGEINIEPKKYLGSDKPVAGQARYLHNIPDLIKLTNPGLEGTGVVVAVWDGGLVQAAHQDFRRGQVVYRDPTRADLFLSNHATHVAGTIAGTGMGRPEAHGMAPGSTIWSFDFNHDAYEMRLEAGRDSPIRVSNHSYGSVVGWAEICRERGVGARDRLVWAWAGHPRIPEDERFGQYKEEASAADKLALDNPFWTQVVSAGNTRNLLLDPYSARALPSMLQYGWLANLNNSFTGEHYLSTKATCEIKRKSSQYHPSNRANGGGFGSIPGGRAIAKNVITVGAMVDPDPADAFDPVTRTFRPIPLSDIKTTVFSSWGPTKDGRIKPDVIANGEALIATAIPRRCANTPCKPAAAASDNANYVQMSGTSMAAPVVSGTLALLNELSVRVREGTPLRSDEAKTLLIHTARSPFEGPDYRIGWGSIQADQAGVLLIRSQPGRSPKRGEHLTIVRVNRSQTIEIKLKRAGGRPVRLTLVWLDHPGSPLSGADNNQSRLVNDLDMELIPPSGDEAQAVLPWVLDHENPAAPATRARNDRDNVERIDISDTLFSNDIWTLRIRGEDWPNADRIAAALAIWGFDIVD